MSSINEEDEGRGFDVVSLQELVRNELEKRDLEEERRRREQTAILSQLQARADQAQQSQELAAAQRQRLHSSPGKTDFASLGRLYAVQQYQEVVDHGGSIALSADALTYSACLSEWRKRRQDEDLSRRMKALQEEEDGQERLIARANIGKAVSRCRSHEQRLKAMDRIDQICTLKIGERHHSPLGELPSSNLQDVPVGPTGNARELHATARERLQDLETEDSGVLVRRMVSHDFSPGNSASGPQAEWQDSLWNFEHQRYKSTVRERLEQEIEKTAQSRINTNAALVNPVNSVKSLLTQLRSRLEEAEKGVTRIRRSRTDRRPGKIDASVDSDTPADGVTGQGIKKQRDELALKATKWGPIHSISLEHRENGVCARELELFIPQQDLHLYQLYCYHKQMIIIIRPVSPSVPDLYAGNFFLNATYCDSLGQPIAQDHLAVDVLTGATKHECRVRGKSIQVSLKSSSYRPIDGLIPVNPALGKAFVEAQRREREIEEMILNAKGGAFTISLVKKLKAQKAQAGSLTQAFRRDIDQALEDSDVACKELWGRYQNETVFSVDKAKISREFLDKFNESQFLGTTQAHWRGFPILYTELPNGDVLRDEKETPIFHIEKAGHCYQFLPAENDISKTPQDVAAPKEAGRTLKPVKVVTHRMFQMSSTTHRIEEEEHSYLIGPDFDGLCYGERIPANRTLEEHEQWAEITTCPRLLPSMGLVTELDIAHIKEVRTLTEWKQNHGYESGNTVKSQPITKGQYIVITPRLVSVLQDFHQIISYYRSAWRAGIPLILNPNWRVSIDPLGLPRPYGDAQDIYLPLVDDCGMSGLMSRFEVDAKHQVELLRENYLSMEERLTVLQKSRRALTGKVDSDTSDDAVTESNLVFDKKRVAQAYFEYRRWQLLPRWFKTFDPHPEDDSPFIIQAPFAEALPDSKFDEGFERYRKDRASALEAPLRTLCEVFQLLHPKSTFAATLLEYVDPEMLPSEGSVGEHAEQDK